VFESMDYNTGLLSWALGSIDRCRPVSASQAAFNHEGLHNGASTVKPTSVPQ
jgi:hypothetical protein